MTDPFRVPMTTTVGDYDRLAAAAAEADTLRERVAARDGALEAMVLEHTGFSVDGPVLRHVRCATCAYITLALAPATVEACDLCGSSDRYRVTERPGDALPIIGCGNPWHYDLPTPATDEARCWWMQLSDFDRDPFCVLPKGHDGVHRPTPTEPAP